MIGNLYIQVQLLLKLTGQAFPGALAKLKAATGQLGDLIPFDILI